RIAQKYVEYTLRLQQRYFRSLATKIEAVLAQEAESGGKAAELAKLKELGIEVSIKLREVFAQIRQHQLKQGGVRQ
ncbi:MAG TPA: hypothetical protein VMW60_03200, partial [Dehalococcoidales bacterium]|nr:hypothetical protein [Dehalococcoidales bacterium]